jgi:hypothetical protein
MENILLIYCYHGKNIFFILVDKIMWRKRRLLMKSSMLFHWEGLGEGRRHRVSDNKMALERGHLLDMVGEYPMDLGIFIFPQSQ